jgi:ribosomal protein S18 acetylase RimI-like enzyme
MKVRIRRSTNNDTDGIFDCHKMCFEQSDQWYKSSIQQFVDSSYVVEEIETKKIIGVLLQGQIVPCEISENDDFLPITKDGHIFKENKLHLETQYGITMVCVLPEYRNKALATKLIELHINEHADDILCLNTRASNKAYLLYKKLGYEHVATIKDKYYFPTEDSYFMIKK